MEAADLNKLAVIISGATGENSSIANGIFFYQGLDKFKKPLYENLINKSILRSDFECKWFVSDRTCYDGIESVESGLGHPSLAAEWEDQLAMKVTTMVSPLAGRAYGSFFFLDRFSFLTVIELIIFTEKKCE